MKLEIPTSWESVNDRITKETKSNSFSSWVDHSPKYKKRNYRLNPKKDNVIRILTKPEGNDFIKEFDYTHNVVTDDGEIFYAKQGAGETPATNEDFAAGRFELGTTAYAEDDTDTFNEFDDTLNLTDAITRTDQAAGTFLVDTALVDFSDVL